MVDSNIPAKMNWNAILDAVQSCFIWKNTVTHKIHGQAISKIIFRTLSIHFTLMISLTFSSLWWHCFQVFVLKFCLCKLCTYSIMVNYNLMFLGIWVTLWNLENPVKFKTLTILEELQVVYYNSYSHTHTHIIVGLFINLHVNTTLTT